MKPHRICDFIQTPCGLQVSTYLASLNSSRLSLAPWTLSIPPPPAQFLGQVVMLVLVPGPCTCHSLCPSPVGFRRSSLLVILLLSFLSFRKKHPECRTRTLVPWPVSGVWVRPSVSMSQMPRGCNETCMAEAPCTLWGVGVPFVVLLPQLARWGCAGVRTTRSLWSRRLCSLCLCGPRKRQLVIGVVW